MKKQAKKAVEKGSSFIRRWWSKKYNRPPNDPRFDSASLAEWLRELYEDLYERRAEVEAQLNDDNTSIKERPALHARLRSLNSLLEETDLTTEDPLIDKWMEELEQGITPNLDEGLPPERK